MEQNRKREEENLPAFILVGRDRTREAAELTAQAVNDLATATDPRTKRKAINKLKKARERALDAVATLSLLLEWNPSARGKKSRQSAKNKAKQCQEQKETDADV
jgi:hypothetical protein